MNEWESIYSQGQQLNRYPYNHVVSFFYRYRPVENPSVLELGCGAGNNLWFLAREGCRVAGIDQSASAIAYAQKRFVAEGLSGDLRVGDFTQPLPFAAHSFNLVIDRSALTYCRPAEARQILANLRPLLKFPATFLFNPYGAGMTVKPPVPVVLYSRSDIREVLAGWNLLEVQKVSAESEFPAETLVEWRVVASLES